jgi:hypothetical protein
MLIREHHGTVSLLFRALVYWTYGRQALPACQRPLDKSYRDMDVPKHRPASDRLCRQGRGEHDRKK